MKKFFDKWVAQSYKNQILTLAVLFLALVIIGGIVGLFVLDMNDPENAKFGYSGTWGIMQCVDGGFVDATITNNTKLPTWIVVFVSLFFWLGGMILVSFFTGAATDFLASRREDILAGKVDYVFTEGYILIIGIDFQVENLIMTLMDETKSNIVVITDSPVEDFLDNLLPALKKPDSRRLFVMRKEIAQLDTYEHLMVTQADEIYLMGDGDANGRDGKTLLALESLSKKAEDEINTQTFVQKKPIKIYMHIADSELYSQIRAMELSADKVKKNDKPVFDLEIFNYYESWVWKCWSQKNAKDGKDEDYLPIKHDKNAKYTELFIIGAGKMGRTMCNFAIPLMNYGEDGKCSKITLFDTDNMKKSALPKREIIDALPEVDVRFENLDGCSDEANDIMLQAASRPDTSVTVVIALSEPDAAIRAYGKLSFQLRRKNISILVWQATQKDELLDKSYLRIGGNVEFEDKKGKKIKGAEAEKTTIRSLGMIDQLPWRNTDRSRNGMAVNFFYNTWFPYGKQYPESPAATDDYFISTAHKMWNDDEAMKMWSGMKRWKKWSSINSGDSFREKSVLFSNEHYAIIADKILKAEHNRWWTERLLAGWKLNPELALSKGKDHGDKQTMEHGDLIPYENLDDEVKDKDKICIAAMCTQGYTN